MFSDAHHVTADEAHRADTIDAAFMAAKFPKFDASRADLVKYVIDVAAVWTAFNRVAAANDRYSVS